MRSRHWRRVPGPIFTPVGYVQPAVVVGGTPYECRQTPFDLTLCKENFPVINEYDDSDLTQAIMQRYNEITPTAAEQTAVLNLVTKVKGIFDKLTANSSLLPSVAIEEYREVGSYRKGTMLKGRDVADIVVTLRSLPTVEAVSALGQKIVAELKANEDENTYVSVPRDFGCEIVAATASIRLLITTIPSNAKLLEPDLHLKESVMIRHMASLRHARWFEEEASNSTIKILVRIIKDIRYRFDQLKELSVWNIELISQYVILNTVNRLPLPVSQAFRRFFQLLAAGFILPTSPAIVDPCEPARLIHQSLTFEQMDQICSCAQTLLRIICHGGYKHVLGLETSKKGLVTDMTFWGDVVVTPLEAAYTEKAMDPLFDEEENAKDSTSPTGSVTVARTQK